MAFFNTIDRLKKTDSTPDQGKPDQSEPEKEFPGEAIEGKETQAKEENAAPGNTPPATKSRKPIRLSFLRPCPLCKGRLFVYGSKEGFFCSACSPHIEGKPVEATGPDRKQSLQDVDSTGPDGSMPEASTRRLGENPENFKAAWPWLKTNLDTLLSAGWTRPALFRRGKHRYPTGIWGAAWYDAWRQDSPVVSIKKNGDISITFNSPGKTITQTIYR